MARKLLMGDIMKRSLRRVDLPDTGGPFTLPEVKALISEQYGHLYSIVVQAGYRYFEADPPQTITATGALSYPLPDDHDCTIGIDRVIDSAGRTEQLDELMVQERNAYSGVTGDACYYSVVGQSIVFFPTPTSGTYTHLYVPQAPDISTLADGAEVDVVTSDGEAFLVYGVAVKLCARTEADHRLVTSERDAAEMRFTRDVGHRATTNPRRRIVRPTPLSDEYYDWSYW